MPLLDHFHPPLYPQRAWESFHSRWANSIADSLQRVLPARYFAEVQIHLGSRIEADVAEFEQAVDPDQPAGNGAADGVALHTWAPPTATLVLPAVFPDDLEVHVRDERDDAQLVAVVELISPWNKDRPDSRRAFAAKSAAYLQRGIGVLVLDIVTSRQANLHNEFMQLLHLGEPFLMSAEVSLSAVSYHPVRRQENNQIELWPVPLALSAPLPLLPLGVRGFRPVPLDLEATYSDARAPSRL